jgi:hypothetical protein
MRSRGYTFAMPPPKPGEFSDEGSPSAEVVGDAGTQASVGSLATLEMRVRVLALVLVGLLAIGLIRQLFELWRGGPAGVPAVSFTLGLICGYALSGFCLWQLWRGQNWARLLVLAWAAVTTARALALLADHALDPAALMARPLTFFESIVAVFLLYWLNTAAVRRRFRRPGDRTALLDESLVGRLCTGVDFVEGDGDSAWRLSFEHGAEVVLHCPWRIVLDNNLAFAFTRVGAGEALSRGVESSPADLAGASVYDPEPNPVPDSPDEARRLLKNLRVTALRIPSHSSDLVVSFEMGIELQTWAPTAPSRAIPGEPASLPLWQYIDSNLTVTADRTEVKQTLPHSSHPQT